MRIVCIAALLLVLAAVCACVNVKAPERIEIGGGPQPENIDSAHAPAPRNLDEARAEIDKAYRQIRYLERELASCQKDKRKYKQERDDYKAKYKRLKND